MTCPTYDPAKFLTVEVSGSCDPAANDTTGDWPYYGGVGVLDASKYTFVEDTDCGGMAGMAYGDGVTGLPSAGDVYGQKYHYIGASISPLPMGSCCGCCLRPPATLTGTVTAQTGDCVNLAPTVLDFLPDSDPANCPSGNFWTNRLQPQPNIPHLGGAGGSGGYIGICCAGQDDWTLISYAGLTFPGCATFRKDLSSCDPFTLVWDFVGAANPTCDPPYGVQDGYHCSGTFRLVVTKN